MAASLDPISRLSSVADDPHEPMVSMAKGANKIFPASVSYLYFDILFCSALRAADPTDEAELLTYD
jgi:hypothetical protein